jgi:hypothetical protein
MATKVVTAHTAYSVGGVVYGRVYARHKSEPRTPARCAGFMDINSGHPYDRQCRPVLFESEAAARAWFAGEYGFMGACPPQIMFRAAEEGSL